MEECERLSTKFLSWLTLLKESALFTETAVNLNHTPGYSWCHNKRIFPTRAEITLTEVFLTLTKVFPYPN